jgi:hypothetical protein
VRAIFPAVALLGDLLPAAAIAKQAECRATFNASLKRNFGPRQQANGDVGLAD